MNRTFEDDVNPQEIVVIALCVYICFLYIYNLDLPPSISAPFIIFILCLELNDWLTVFIFILSSAALFLLFTSMLVVTHINLILKGQTTVESVQIMSMKDRENRTLAKGFDCWEIRSVNFFPSDKTCWLSNVVSSAKRRKQQEWDQEWGRLNAEGHIWWRGNLREHWTDVMGDWWLGWIRECFSYIPRSIFFPFVPECFSAFRRLLLWFSMDNFILSIDS